jgi:hypothetical protein
MRSYFLRRSGLGLIGLAITAYFVAATWIKTTYAPTVIRPNVTGRIYRIYGPMISHRDSNFAIAAPDHFLAGMADIGADTTRSEVVIYEDNVPLGPGHVTRHETIAEKGRGRFSHWGRADIFASTEAVFIFSSSDNTDPRTNRRGYWAVVPDVVDPSANLKRERDPGQAGKLVARSTPDGRTFWLELPPGSRD